jgi:hypothetical protein
MNKIFQDVPNVTLVAVPPESWHLLHFPAYQRRQTQNKVRDIARGIENGYMPAPIILYKTGASYRIVDGGHRFQAFRRVHERTGLAPAIPALIYGEEAGDQNVIFVNENCKMRMDPTAIIRADNSRAVSVLLRGLGGENEPFEGCGDLADYPVRPLSIVKAALCLHAEGDDLDHNRLCYLSVARALDELEAIIAKDDGWWRRVVIPFLNCELALWGEKGRHLVNFAVIGFALFLAKNRTHFFTKSGDLVIKTTRTHVSQKRGSREIALANDDRSDFAKLKALKKVWDEPGTRLYSEAPRNPLVVAGQINDHFWKNRKRSVRAWRPELTW